MEGPVSVVAHRAEVFEDTRCLYVAKMVRQRLRDLLPASRYGMSMAQAAGFLAARVKIVQLSVPFTSITFQAVTLKNGRSEENWSPLGTQRIVVGDLSKDVLFQTHFR